MTLVVITVFHGTRDHTFAIAAGTFSFCHFSIFLRGVNDLGLPGVRHYCRVNYNHKWVVNAVALKAL